MLLEFYELGVKFSLLINCSNSFYSWSCWFNFPSWNCCFCCCNCLIFFISCVCGSLCTSWGCASTSFLFFGSWSFALPFTFWVFLERLSTRSFSDYCAFSVVAFFVMLLAVGPWNFGMFYCCASSFCLLRPASRLDCSFGEAWVCLVLSILGRPLLAGRLPCCWVTRLLVPGTRTEWEYPLSSNLLTASVFWFCSI